MGTESHSVDCLLVFPPQWSPFQPPLSIPSLKAWVKRAGFSAQCVDANILFYHWLLSNDCALLLRRLVSGSGRKTASAEAYSAIFGAAAAFRQNMAPLFTSSTSNPPSASFLDDYYIAVRTLESYLDAVSDVAGFRISAYSFELENAGMNGDVLEDFVHSPNPLIAHFCEWFVEEHFARFRPSMVGLSCIGQEQVPCTLLLGHLIKKRLDNVPVLVGGTVFSRLYERGTLRSSWFGEFFDCVVRNEGERPLESLLRNSSTGRPLYDGVPGLVYRRGAEILASEPACSLTPDEVPIPDFDEMPLNDYLSPSITLPILSSRGCYWGKCEFCHHGMVYGERYSAYGTDSVIETIRTLSRRYEVNHFAFNDEAIPPKVVRRLGESLPAKEDSGWSFTGLIKFEPYFTARDFANLARCGFRSLYVGLESGSERVLRLMKKNNTQKTMVRNLKDSAEAGIWMHCFVFFGFPGEEEDDARETYDFVMRHSEIIGGFGCGTFSLEHNAPIFGHLEEFGLRLRVVASEDVNVYYNYDVRDGIGAARAREWQERLNKDANKLRKFRAGNWIPREHLLLILESRSQKDIEDAVGCWEKNCGLPSVGIRKVMRVIQRKQGTALVINLLSRRVMRLEGPAAELFKLLEEKDVNVDEISDIDRGIIENVLRVNLQSADPPAFVLAGTA